MTHPQDPDGDPNGPVPVDPPARSALTVLGIVLIGFVAWVLSDMLLMAFGAILLAVLLRRGAAFVARHTPLGPKAGLGIVCASIAAAVTIFVTIYGPRVAAEFEILAQTLPTSVETLAASLRERDWGAFLLDNIPAPGDGPGINLFGTIGGTLSSAFSTATSLLVLLSLSIFLALDPGLYRRGLLHLVPKPRRDRIAEVLDALGHNLWKWLQGQLLDMVAVAVLTGVGLWLLGVPLAVTLGLIAGVTNFIPYVGPFLSAVPAILIAFAHDPNLAIWTLGLFVFVQQLEGNVLLPIIQKRATSLPPVLSILAIVAFGVLFGFLGLVVATPLMLVLIILVRMLYVEDVLKDYDADPIGNKSETKDTA